MDSTLNDGDDQKWQVPFAIASRSHCTPISNGIVPTLDRPYVSSTASLIRSLSPSDISLCPVPLCCSGQSVHTMRADDIDYPPIRAPPGGTSRFFPQPTPRRHYTALHCVRWATSVVSIDGFNADLLVDWTEDDGGERRKKLASLCRSKFDLDSTGRSVTQTRHAYADKDADRAKRNHSLCVWDDSFLNCKLNVPLSQIILIIMFYWTPNIKISQRHVVSL